MKPTSGLCAALALSGALCSANLPAPLLAAQPVPPPPSDSGGSRWSVSVGATVRAIEADFKVPAPVYTPRGLGVRGAGTQPLPLFGNPGSGPFLFDPNLAVNYDDGFVGTFFSGTDGDWYTEFASMSQLTPSGRSYSNTGGGTNVIYDLTFTSNGGSRQTTFARAVFSDLAGSDSETAVGPSLRLDYNLASGPSYKLAAGLSYSFLPASLGIRGGMGGLAVFRKTERFTHRYRYDLVDFDADGLDNNIFVGDKFPNAGYAISDPNIAYNSLYYDVAPGQSNPFLPPSHRRAVSSNTKRVAAYTAAGFADLDVNLHEIALTGSLLFPLGDRLSVGLTGGPTLNIVDSDFTAGINIYRNGSQSPVAKFRQHSSETEVALGAMLDLVICLDLTSDGRWFAQLQGGYRWVDDVDVKAGASTADIDLSDFAGTASIGFNF